MSSTTFGIDLGSTNSVAAIWKNGDIEVLAYKTGSRVFPSCVAYNKRNPTYSIIGYFAKQKMQTTSYGVFHHVRDLLGVSYDNPIVAEMRGSVGYDIRNGADGKLVVAIQTEAGDVVKHPEDVEAMILSAIAEEMKGVAGFDIRNAVITVPTYFDQYKRDLTKLAGQIAGLNVRAIISEPQAAAYAYLDFTNEDRDLTLMIYDLGGRTFDVTILAYEGDEYTELATDGDIFCGGHDFDKLILDEMKKRYMDETGEPIPAKLIAKVLSKCEQAKIDLRTSRSTEIDITDDVIIDFTRAEMNRLIEPKLADTLKICDRAIAAAKITVLDIDSIILVGGSTQLRLVEELLKSHFPKVPIKGNISPDECVAYGAAKYGHNLDIHPVSDPIPPSPLVSGSVEEYLKMFESRYPDLPPFDEYEIDELSLYNQLILSDENGRMQKMNLCKMDIGISIGGRMEVLIPRNTVLPVSKKKMICLKDIYQSEINISIYQGIDSIAKNNDELKRLEVKLGHYNCSIICLVLDMNREGVLSERVIDCETGHDMECKSILLLSADGTIKGSQNGVDQQKRRARNSVRALDIIRNRLQKWGFSLIEEGASEEDQKKIYSNYSRLQNEPLSVNLITEIYTIFTHIRWKI